MKSDEQVNCAGRAIIELPALDAANHWTGDRDSEGYQVRLPVGAVDDEVATSALLPADSPRLNGEDPGHVRVLASVEADLPPILVSRSTMRVIDGMHRLRAARLKGQQTVPVRYFEGNDGEAFILAVKVNTAHGLPLTLADREAAASRILVAEQHRSDRWIARTVGLAAGTVAAIRRRVIPDSGGNGAAARVGSDGRVRPVDGTAGRLLASEAIAKHPGASLREIARIAGISPATARDVRVRMQRGEHPVPTSSPTGGAQRTADDGRTSAGVTRRGPRRSPRDPLVVMQDLRNDPSLRLTDSGRTLLRWLTDRTAGPRQLQVLMKSTPPHCAYLVAELARWCGNEWLNFAAQLEDRLRTMS